MRTVILLYGAEASITIWQDFWTLSTSFLKNIILFGNSANAYLNGDTSLTPGMLLSPWAFLSAFGFCLLMNLLSAGIPAWRASRMNIVDAINQRGEVTYEEYIGSD